MGTLKAGRRLTPTWTKQKLIYSAIFLAFLLTVALYINNNYRVLQPASLLQGAETISQSALEEQYGLRVNLVAVTAAGGLVDLRFKIIDGEKAKSFLQDPKHSPSLWIADGKVHLTVPDETVSQEIQFEDDGNLFLMFPNARGIVKPGTPVTIRFGETQLEPILAK